MGKYDYSRGGLKHIETDHAIVNIKSGLFDDEGHEVTSVEILPDSFAGEPQTIVDVGGQRVKALHVRIIHGKTREEKML